ncbi:MAG TPA: nucleotidyltransferase family protein [Tepidisphaeraceae bacterium]|jgi:hypothetical protein
MDITLPTSSPLEPTARHFYLNALHILDQQKIDYLIGGGYAMASYTGIHRQTKDLDVFIRQQDRDRVLAAMQAAGYGTEIPWPHFLAKVISGDAFIDILYNSGNGLSAVDDACFAHAKPGEVLGKPVKLSSPEDMIWSKAFVMDRDRFDGADVNHLIKRWGKSFDWNYLLARFSGHERVLLAQLLLYGYVYPAERDLVPAGVIEQLMGRIRAEAPEQRKICRGGFLSQNQYLVDFVCCQYQDGRQKPLGPLTEEEIKQFTRP